MNPEFWRYLAIFVAIMAFFRWSHGGRRWGRGWIPVSPDQLGNREELSSIENRLLLMERLEGRVEELENRLDFTERLLASKSAGIQ